MRDASGHPGPCSMNVAATLDPRGVAVATGPARSDALIQAQGAELYRVGVDVQAVEAGPLTRHVERRRVMVDGPEKSFPLALSERPKSLTFNADSEVLSKTRRE